MNLLQNKWKLKEIFFYRLIDTAITSIKSHFEQLELWKLIKTHAGSYIGNIFDLPENDTLVKHCMDLHNTLQS